MTVATAITDYHTMGEVDIDICTTSVIPIGMTRFGRFVNSSPLSINPIFHPNIDIGFIAKTMIIDVFLKPAIGIGFYHRQFFATVKIGPPPGPKTEPWMEQFIVFRQGFPNYLKIP